MATTLPGLPRKMVPRVVHQHALLQVLALELGKQPPQLFDLRSYALLNWQSHHPDPDVAVHPTSPID